MRSVLRNSPVSVRTLLRRWRFYSHWSVDSDTGIVSSKEKGSPQFQTVIGLEVHAQLGISTKLFSGCPRSSTVSPPNTQLHSHDVAVPGFLPRISQEAVQAAILSAAATKCKIQPVSRFERKHYFYADLPLGYQVTQQRWPLARDGVLICKNPSKIKNKRHKSRNTAGNENDAFSARIERIQLEQDTGKTIMSTRNGITKSLVDFNRAGCALIEIVFHPDLRSSTQASRAVETLRNLLRHIGTCDGKMEEGSLRCDLNVSIAPIYNGTDCGSESETDILSRTGHRVEVKNLNSLRQIQQAAEFEAIRQAGRLESGSPTEQETRTFDVKTGKTTVIRTKEGANDYRFMPEPDLPPLILNETVFDGRSLEGFISSTLPELPEDARRRLSSQYGLSDYLANVLTGDPPAITLFDDAVEEARKQVADWGSKGIPETVANLICNELFALVREDAQKPVELIVSGAEPSVRHSKVTGSQLGEIVALQSTGVISNTMAKQLLKIMFEEEIGKRPRDVAKARGFELVADTVRLAQLCGEVLNEHPEELEKYKQGEKFAGKMFKFFLGRAMAKSKSNAHPERLSEVLQQVLGDVENG